MDALGAGARALERNESPRIQLCKFGKCSGQEYKCIIYKSLSNGIFYAFLFTAVLAYMMEMPMTVLILAVAPFFMPGCEL